MPILNNRAIDRLVSKADPQSILNWFGNNPSFMHVPILIAQNKAVPLTIGEDILFDSEDLPMLEALNRWADTVRLYEKMKQVVYQMSLWGKSIPYLERKNKTDEFPNGLLMFKLPNMLGMSSVAKVDDVEQMAVLYTNTNRSDSPSLQKITFIPGKMIIQDFANPDSIRAQDVTVEVEKGLQAQGNVQVVENSLDFVPFQEFLNKQVPNLYNVSTTYFASFPDWWFGRKLIFDIEDNLDKKRKERGKNMTRAIGSLDPKIHEKITSGQIEAEDYLGELFFNANTTAYTTGGNDIAIIQGDPKLDVYSNDTNNTLEKIFEMAGYNYYKDDGNYENKTKSIMNYDLDNQTTKTKQKDIKVRLYRMIDLVLKDMGFEPIKNGVRDYEVSFVGTNIIDDIRQLDIIDRRLLNGTLEPVRAIQQLDNVSRATAEEYVEKHIKPYQDEVRKKEAESMFGGEDGESGEGLAKGKGVDE